MVGNTMNWGNGGRARQTSLLTAFVVKTIGVKHQEYTGSDVNTAQSQRKMLYLPGSAMQIAMATVPHHKSTS